MQTEIRRIKSNTFFYIPFIGTCGRHMFLRKDRHIKGARFKKCGQTEQTVILIKKTHTLIRRDYGGVTQMTMTYKVKQKYLISFIPCLLCERTDPSSPPLLPPPPYHHYIYLPSNLQCHVRTQKPFLSPHTTITAPSNFQCDVFLSI